MEKDFSGRAQGIVGAPQAMFFAGQKTLKRQRNPEKPGSVLRQQDRMRPEKETNPLLQNRLQTLKLHLPKLPVLQGQHGGLQEQLPSLRQGLHLICHRV